MTADKFRLVVSGLMGKVWIAKLSSKPHIMTTDRREVPKSEFIDAILQWVGPQLTKTSDTVCITLEGKVIAEITIKDRSIYKK